jgi:hypothetical protein
MYFILHIIYLIFISFQINLYNKMFFLFFNQYFSNLIKMKKEQFYYENNIEKQFLYTYYQMTDSYRKIIFIST